MLLCTATCPGSSQLLQEFLEMGSLWDDRCVSVNVVVSLKNRISVPWGGWNQTTWWSNTIIDELERLSLSDVDLAEMLSTDGDVLRRSIRSCLNATLPRDGLHSPTPIRLKRGSLLEFNINSIGREKKVIRQSHSQPPPSPARHPLLWLQLFRKLHLFLENDNCLLHSPCLSVPSFFPSLLVFHNSYCERHCHLREKSDDETTESFSRGPTRQPNINQHMTL